MRLVDKEQTTRQTEKNTEKKYCFLFRSFRGHRHHEKHTVATLGENPNSPGLFARFPGYWISANGNIWPPLSGGFVGEEESEVKRCLLSVSKYLDNSGRVLTALSGVLPLDPLQQSVCFGPGSIK